jgi:hypothetical protein
MMRVLLSKVWQSFFQILFLFIRSVLVIISEGFFKLKVLNFPSILKPIVIIGKGFSKLCMLKKFSI